MYFCAVCRSKRKQVISLHMWETIWEASASCSGWNFGSKIPVYPKLGFGPQFTPLPPKFGQHLEFWVETTRVYSPPKKILKIEQDLALWVVNTPVPHLPGVTGSSHVETNYYIPRGYRLVYFRCNTCSTSAYLYSPAGRPRRRACPSPGRCAVRYSWTSSRTRPLPSRRRFYKESREV